MQGIFITNQDDKRHHETDSSNTRQLLDRWGVELSVGQVISIEEPVAYLHLEGCVK